MPEQVLLDVGIWIAGESYAGVSTPWALRSLPTRRRAPHSLITAFALVPKVA